MIASIIEAILYPLFFGTRVWYYLYCWHKKCCAHVRDLPDKTTEDYCCACGQVLEKVPVEEGGGYRVKKGRT